jgi:hypothetical protein
MRSGGFGAVFAAEYFGQNVAFEQLDLPPRHAATGSRQLCEQDRVSPGSSKPFRASAGPRSYIVPVPSRGVLEDESQEPPV